MTTPTPQLAALDVEVRHLARAVERNTEQTERIAQSLEDTLDKLLQQIDALKARVTDLEKREAVREGQVQAAAATSKLFWGAIVTAAGAVGAVLPSLLTKLGVL